MNIIVKMMSKKNNSKFKMDDFEFEEYPDVKKFVISIDQLKFEEVIGLGGFGEVSIGYFLPTGIKVAIKKLHFLENNKRNMQLYQREVLTHATLRHRFLVPFIGFTNKPPFCIVTKYMENGSLYKILHCEDGKTKLTPTQLTMIAYGISVGMQYLHSHNIIHRDLKTQNVLLDEQYMPIIADFGSSRKLDSVQAMTGLFGTTNYMAPEFIHGEEYDEKVDVYSFGLILWELFTKCVPFDGLESAQVIFLVFIQQTRPPIPENTPQPLAKLIECCWAQNPKDRPPFQKIIPLFENGTVEFPHTDRAKFNGMISQFSLSQQLKLSRRHSNANLLSNFPMEDDIANIQMSRESRNFRSVASLHTNRNFSHNLTQKANEYLYALNSNNTRKIMQALDFFENLVSNPNIITINVWPQFLIFLCSEQPVEFVKRGESLCIQFAKVYEVLKGIAQVADLEQYVKPNTLDIFLYVINYLQSIVDINSIVKHLFELFKNQECSKKAITLVCKVIQNSPSPLTTKTILTKFRDGALKYVNTNGGNLIVLTLIFYDCIPNVVISAYAQSKIPENAVAAYQALFVTRGNPALFTLDNILSHITSNDENLRNQALEYVRRLAENASNGPLSKLIVALFESAIKYESEKATLLLVRIACNPQTSSYIFKAGNVDQWLNTKPKIAVNMLKLFIASINTDNRYKKYLFQQPNLATFFANILKANDDDATVAACWAISKNMMTLEFATALVDSGFLPMLCDLINLDKSEDPKRYVHFLNVFTMIAQYVYHEKFIKVSETLLKMISDNSPISYYCIISLAAISIYVQIHQTILDKNVSAVLTRYIDNGDSKKYKQKILDNLRKGGLLNNIY